MITPKILTSLLVWGATICVSTSGLAQTDNITQIGDSYFNQIAMIDSTQLDFDALTIFPGYGLFVRENAGGEYCALDSTKCTDFKHLKFLDHIWYDQLIATPNHTLVRSDQHIYDLGENQCQLVTELENQSFRLFSANDSTFLVVTYQDEGSSLYRYNLKHNEGELLATNSKHIYGAEQFGNDMWFVAGNALYEINNKEIKKQFAYQSEEFIGMVLTHKGILAYTLTKVILFDGDQAYPIATGQFYRLLYDLGRTYFVLQDGTVLATNAF